MASTTIDPFFNLFFFHEINSKKSQSLNKINVYKKLYFVVIVKKKISQCFDLDWLEARQIGGKNLFSFFVGRCHVCTKKGKEINEIENSNNNGLQLIEDKK